MFLLKKEQLVKVVMLVSFNQSVAITFVLILKLFKVFKLGQLLNYMQGTSMLDEKMKNELFHITICK